MSNARLVLVSCVKTKRAERTAARDLYTSPLFRGMRGYAEASGAPWYILSAEYGVLDPDAIVAPYERTLNTMSAAKRGAWGLRVCEQLASIVAKGTRVEILAGARYRERVVPFLTWVRDCTIVEPLRGMGLGQQISYLKRFTQ